MDLERSQNVHLGVRDLSHALDPGILETPIDQVDLAGLECEIAAGIRLDVAKQDLLDLRSAAEIGLVGLQLHILLGAILDELERTRSNGLTGEFGAERLD